MSTLLVRNAAVVATMDDAGTEIVDGGVYAEDGWITQVGATTDLPGTADDVIDATGAVVVPGLVNTHHHLYQTLTRAVPGAQDAGLFDWLRTLYPIWSRLTPEHVSTATITGLAELALSGCTTAFDHQYLWPNGSRLDDQFEAAARVGLRFHGSRGSMSVGESAGGLPPDSVVEDEEAILADTERVIDAFHDPERGSMRQVVVAPCSPFSVSPQLMAAAAELARDRGVRLHTHLAETADEDDYCRSTFGRPPVAFAESVGWVGDDVWWAHAVHVVAAEIGRMAHAGTGVAHCPTSNMRLASGIAPLRAYLDHGVPVGLGVDGSASNDGSHLLAEARQAMLLARLATAPGLGDGGPQLEARTALRLATRGGAAVLGRVDVGSIEVGKAADVGVFDISGLEHAGAADPVAALLLCAPQRAVHVVVGGRRVVADGRLVHIDEERHAATHRALARSLIS